MLSIKNLQVAYGSHLVLNDLDATFEQGEIHGILGMNGSGKTTFFNALYGMVPAQKRQMTFLSEALQPKHIAYLQTRNYFYPYLRGREYLELLSQGSNAAFSIDEWNKIFQLPLDQMIDQYSTGMKKKLAFLGMLTFDRPILILDEPFNGVDVESAEKIDIILRRLKKQNKTILISSHIINALTHLCDDVYILRNARFEKKIEAPDFQKLKENFKQDIHKQIEDSLDELL
ncbi:MAG TPA: ABC transporter ATP-binding protein [Phaeodactylibacter sp.]|nr:ABC transporter ATP-binding protein [Phaeodactylibacter sp.]